MGTESGEETLRVSLEDDASTPANTAAGALERLAAAFDNLAGNGVERYFGSIRAAATGAEGALQKLRSSGQSSGSAIERAFAKVKDVGKSAAAALESSFAKAANSVASTLDGIKDAKKGIEGAFEAVGLNPDKLIEYGKKAIELSFEFGKAVLNAQAFKEDVTRALVTVMKSKGAAEDVLSKASETAGYLGKKDADTAGQFADLLTKGFDVSKVDRIIKSLADLGTVDPKANLETATRIIGKIKGLGKGSLDAITELNAAGLESGDVFAAMADRIHKPLADIPKLLSAGKVGAEDTIEAILTAINKQVGGGDVGAAAHAKSREDLSSLMDQMKSIPENILWNVKAGPGIDKVKKFMSDTLDFFSSGSSTGKETAQVVGDVFNALAEGFFGVDFSKGGTKDALAQLIAGVKEATPDIKSAAAGLRAIGEAGLWMTAKIGQVVGAVSSVKQSVVDFFGYTPPGGIWGALLLAPITGAAQALKAIAPEFYAAGADLIAGLINGITSRGEAAIATVKGFGSSLISTLRGVFKSHSPSEVTTDIGGDFGEGPVIGINSKRGRVNSAAEALGKHAIKGAEQAFEGVRSPASKGGVERIFSAALASNDNGVGLPRVRSPDVSAEFNAIEARARTNPGADLAALGVSPASPARREPSGEAPTVHLTINVGGAPPGSTSEEHADSIARAMRREIRTVFRDLLREAS